MNFWPSWVRQGSLRPAEIWHLRARTLEALGFLCLARLAVAWLPFSLWRGWLGLNGPAVPDAASEALRMALHVERAATRLPFPTLCLPRAMALSWVLLRRGIAHQLVIAARPAGQRGGTDDLHAWVEAGGQIVLGALPGPWLETTRFPHSTMPGA